MPEGKDGAVRLIACQDFALPVTLVNLYLKQLRAIKNSLKGLRFIRGTSSSLRMLMKCEALESTHHLRSTQVQLLFFPLFSKTLHFLKKKKKFLMFCLMKIIVFICLFFLSFMNSKITARFEYFRKGKRGGR